MRNSLPLANGSPDSRLLSEMPRLIELRLEDVEHGLRALLGVRLDEDRLAAPLDRGAGALEVVALLDLLAGLVEGVVRLLVVDLADDVEGRISHAGESSREGCRGPGLQTWPATILPSMPCVS